MLTSLLEFLPEPRLEDTGLPHQLWLYEHFSKEFGTPPPVLDAKDVLENPRRLLAQLCERVGVPFFEQMLRWEPGLRPTDGVWARHWYAKVAQTTSFAPYRPKPDVVPEHLEPLLAECDAVYDRLYAHRLK
jgi:hypothetical protein